MNTLEENKQQQEVETKPNIETALTEFADVGDVQQRGSAVYLPASLGSDGEDLNEFFSRPLKIYNGTDNAFTLVQLNPFQLYFTNPAVVRKLANYRYLRCTMNVRYSESYNPYVYGRRYMTLYPSNTNKIYEWPNYTTLQNVRISPNDVDTYQLTIPYTRVQGTHYPVRDLVAGTFTEWFLNLYQPVLYKTANGDPVDGQYSIHVWLTDVELAVPVASGTLQSGKYKEFKGMVSAPATAVKNAARELGKAPSLKPIATPIEVAAGFVADMASLFGFSKPNQLNAPEPYMWNPEYNMGLSSTVDVSQKLTLDGKQGVSVSTEPYDGSQLDNLAFKNFTQRECVIVERVWTTAFQSDTVIASIPVTPGLYELVTPERITLTPLAEVANLFKYWRGTIKYKVSVVASKFHRGRLRIFWSPARLQVPFTEPISNLVESYIMDITTESEVDIEVKYCSGQPYSEIAFLTEGQTYTGSVNPGYLYVTVHQELSAPVNTADAWLHISISSDDVEFAEPSASCLQLFNNGTVPGGAPNRKVPSDTTILTTYGGFTAELEYPPNPNFQSGALVEFSKKPKKHVFNTKSDYQDSNVLHIGEAILSYRTLCKMYTPYETGLFPTRTSTISYWSYLSFPNIPKLAGAAFGGTIGLKMFRSPLTHVMNSFRFMRGSVRYKIVFFPDDDTNSIVDELNLMVLRIRANEVPQRYGGTLPNVEDPGGSNFWFRSMQGIAFDRKSNSITFEIPYTTLYNYYRTTWMTYGNNPNNLMDQAMVAVLLRPGQKMPYQAFVSIGEDFNLVTYTGQGSVYIGNIFMESV